MKFLDLLGTVFSKFQIGIGGPNLKNNSGTLEIRNTADTAYAMVAALLFKTYGNDFELNSGAAGAGADWKFILRRPSTGMTHDITVVFPATDPAVNQALTVASFAANVITLQWTTVAAGTDKSVYDTTALAFGTASPVSLFSLPANAVYLSSKIIIDTPFNGTPSLSIGISGNTAKYLAATQVDLTAAAGTVFDITPGLAASASIEALIATYAAGGATAGAGRILVAYVIPS